MISSLSPLDGRYEGKTRPLGPYFSEYALIRYRIIVEIQYLLALSDSGLPEVDFGKEERQVLLSIVDNFDEAGAQKIKDIEKVTNHDVKAVEYYIKDIMTEAGMSKYLEFVHFALTSQDINNTALPLMLQDALNDILLPELEKVVALIEGAAESWWSVPMLARTHGQPASPTTMGKEIMVFAGRLNHQISALKDVTLRAKFGGATGQFNAHHAAYPNVDWPGFADDFIESLGLERAYWTTQIAHYDDHAELFDALARINTILIDLCRDIWTYISLSYFGQKTVANEVGSSAMPHKVNPIDFENAEGNLGLANAVFRFLSEKLPISRLQRDLTDSTVSRNVGVPFGHTLIALKSIQKGWSKLQLNPHILDEDLERNWAVTAEAIQNILRREGYPKPYEALKALTRGKTSITKEDIQSFIKGLDITDEVKKEMLMITPQNYIGILGK